MNKRMGVLCHVTMLKSGYGVGDFGKSAIDFIDFLAENNIGMWQILPLTETNEFNCPYGSGCFFALDEMFVSPDELIRAGKIKETDLEILKKCEMETSINYRLVKKEKHKLLEKAFAVIKDKEIAETEEFLGARPWLGDYAYYKSLLEVYDTHDFRIINKKLWEKQTKEYVKFYNENYKVILKYAYFQYILYKQWKNVKKYAQKKGIKIIGDMPIYPEQNSFDVFKYGDNFLLDNKTKRPLVYGGVPADDFNALGQNWHTCVYDWKKLKQTNFEFLTKKITILMDLYHCLRLDHFIGYVKCYQIDAKHEQKVKWVDAGGEDCIKTIVNKFGKNSFIVEDLGLKIPEVQEVKQKYGLTGMKVMQFELDKCPNEYCYEDKNNITYLGTHDNNTFIGYLNRLSLEQKKQIAKSLGKRYYTDEKLTIEILQKLLSYKNNKVIVGVQDLLLQGEEFRTNVPGKAQGCWEYRLPENYKTKIKQTLKIITGEK